MLYALEQGPVEQEIIKAAVRMHMPIPSKINNAPNLMQGLELYFIAYEELVSYNTAQVERPGLLWADVQHYAEYFCFSRDQRDELMHFCREMELAFTQWRRKKQPKGNRGGGNNTKTTVAAHSKAQQAHRAKR